MAQTEYLDALIVRELEVRVSKYIGTRIAEYKRGKIRED
jgi:hypothetical protein